ncbi:MAG: hypothetical protein V7K54_19260 [Nostoc sp.]
MSGIDLILDLRFGTSTYFDFAQYKSVQVATSATLLRLRSIQVSTSQYKSPNSWRGCALSERKSVSKSCYAAGFTATLRTNSVERF